LSGRVPAPCRLNPRPPIRSRCKHTPLGRTAYRPQLPALTCAHRPMSSERTRRPAPPATQRDDQAYSPRSASLGCWRRGRWSCCAHRQATAVQPLGYVARARHLELEVLRLPVEGRANVRWPRPRSHWQDRDCRLVAAVARHLGVDEPAQKSLRKPDRWQRRRRSVEVASTRSAPATALRDKPRRAQQRSKLGV
jgi:hypothetical protein